MDAIDKRKILIVDDVPTNLNLLIEILMNDYKLVCATNGKDAIKLASNSQPDLILLDVMMPEMDGYEVCRCLKSDEKFKDIPIFFLTANTEEEEEEKGLSCGAVDYISKPFSATVLQHKIRIHIELKLHRENLQKIIKKRDTQVSDSNARLHQETAERLQIQKDLIEQQAYFSQLFEKSPHAIMILEPSGKIVEVNQGFEKIFGYPEEELKGRYDINCIVPEEMIPENEIFYQSILAGNTISKETFRFNRKRELIPVSFLGYPAVVNGKIEGLFVLYKDISERKKFEAQILHQAFHDPLTAIPNRALLMERILRCLERSKRRQQYQFAVLMIDLDDFKSVNDSLGHLAGDKFLIQLSTAIKKQLRATDTIARMGGDEFAVLLEDFSDPKEVLRIVERISKKARETYTVDRNEIRISASIGIVIETKTYASAEEILRDADIAMYRVKETGKSGYKIFEKKMHQKTMESLKMQRDLRLAIENQEFVLHYQPIISVAQKAMVGFEALIRWEHPTKGLVGPNEFIQVAEETDFIIPIGRIVIEQACRQLKKWHEEIPGASHLTMNVNISTKQFLDEALIRFIQKTMAECNLAPGTLNLEITESLLMNKANAILAKLAELKESGVKVVLDDFGTGYSSLAYIHDFDIDSIKVDRSFINDMEQDGGSIEIVKTILGLCKNLNLGVVAEGVENASQLSLLNQLNCERIQGFYFSRPLAAPEATKLIRNWDYDSLMK